MQPRNKVTPVPFVSHNNWVNVVIFSFKEDAMLLAFPQVLAQVLKNCIPYPSIIIVALLWAKGVLILN